MKPKYCRDCAQARTGNVMKETHYNPNMKPERQHSKYEQVQQCHPYAFTIRDGQKPIPTCRLGEIKHGST